MWYPISLDFDTKPGYCFLWRREAFVKCWSSVQSPDGGGYIRPARLWRWPWPVYRDFTGLAARSTARTVFQNHDDLAYFERHRMVGRGSQSSDTRSGRHRRVRAGATPGPSPAQLRDELGLGASEVVITVTRMTRQKGILTLLEAAAFVHQARPGVRFLLVGPRQSEGPLAVTQAEIDRHAPYVMAIGPRSDVPALLASPTCSRSRPNIARAFRARSLRPHSPACRSLDEDARAASMSFATAGMVFWFRPCAPHML